MNDPIRLDKPSASSFNITALCPGSEGLIRSVQDQLPAEEPDEVAERGTRIHRAWETDNTDDLDEADLEIYKAGVKYKEQAVAEWCQAHEISEFKEGPRELRLWLHDPETMEPLSSGMMDWHFIAGKHLLVGDFKSLWCPNLTPAFQNWQIRTLVVLASREYDVETIRGVLVKPSVRFKKIDAVDYSKSDIEHSEKDILHSLWRAKQPDAPRYAGPHCSWCKGKPFCPEAASYSMLPSVIAGSELELSPVGPVALVERLDPKDLALLWDRSSVIVKILDAVKVRLKMFSDEELSRLGLQKKEGRKLDPIVATKALYDFLLNNEKVSESELWEALSFSKGDLKKALMRDKGWKGEQTANYLTKMLEPFIEPKISEPSLERKV